MQRVLVSAQGFGFGPAAKGAVVASLLRRDNPHIAIDFIGTGTAYELANTRRNIFQNVYDNRQRGMIEQRISDKYYDAVVSVMEPKIVLTAHIYKVPVVLIDSLYWFWDWRPDRIDFLDNLPVQTLEDLAYIGKNTHPHEQQYLAHKYALISYLQACFDEEKASRNIEYIPHKKIVAPIVDASFAAAKKSDNNTAVLSFCGQFNPIVKPENVLDYCKLILGVTKDGFGEFLQKEENRLLIIGHPFVMKNLAEIIKQTGFPSVLCKHLNYHDYYETISSASAVIAPPSLTTFYESRAYDKPLIFLPEQHDGHWPNYRALTGHVENPEEIFPGQMLTPFIRHLKGMKESDITVLYEHIADILHDENGAVFTALKHRYGRILADIAGKAYRKSLAEKQRLYFERCFSFPAARIDEITADMERLL